MATAAVNPRSTDQPVTLSAATSAAWMAAMLVVGLLAYYFIGVDQGATSVFGNDTHIHEFVHDARHFLGFPCH
jgi:hypothetical protein